MLKIKNTLSFAALVCGLLICFNAPAAAQGYVPTGSYQQSCTDYTNAGGDLKANCKAKGGGTFTTGGGGMWASTLVNFFECQGDIANNNGNLECTRNINSPRMVKTRDALFAEYKAVTGSKFHNYEEYTNFLRLMFQGGLSRQFFSGGYGADNIILRNFLLTWLNKPENISRKAEVVERAFRDVYSWGANPKDLAFYNSQNIGYTDVVVAETAKLSSNPSVRHVMINVAYKKTLGRMPTAGDRAYWVPRTEYFTQIVDANRAYLYSPNGANDLVETVKRVLSSNMSGEPTSAQIKSAIAKYTPKKAIFDEM